jgi:hypothetical protein
LGRRRVRASVERQPMGSLCNRAAGLRMPPPPPL